MYLVRKPVGITSFSVVSAFKERADQAPGRPPKLCHGGTLDPFAEGLLLVLSGWATKVFELLHEAPKQYLAEVVWGSETDSDDALGKSHRRAPLSTAEQLEASLERFLGWHEQVPPVMSNKRVSGERAHLRARRGEPVELAPVRVYLHEARWIHHRRDEGGAVVESTLAMTCRGGFYVRSLAREVGRVAGTAGHVRTLHRTAIGPFAEPQAEPKLVSEADTLPWLELRTLSDEEWGMIRRGEPVPVGRLQAPEWTMPKGYPSPTPLVRAVHAGRLVALLERRSERLAVRLLLRR